MQHQQLKKLTLESLAEIDGGRLKIAFEQALKRIIEDCEDRPGVKKARTLNLQLDVLPAPDATGVCDDAKVQATITDNVPKRKTKIWDMSLRKGGHLLFRPDSLDDVEQQAMDFDD